MNNSLNQPRGALLDLTSNKDSDSEPRYLFFWSLLCLSSIALFVRIDDLTYISESLSAEDGMLFIAQSHQLGMKSLWVPHTGYLFLYSRIIALLSRPVPLVAIPHVFFLARLMTFYVIVYILKNRAESAGLDKPLTAFLVCAIALQPNYGEAFFNLNTSTYFLGIALAFHVCIPRRDCAPLSTTVFLVLASLTGPFSTLMLPILCLQLLLLRDFLLRKTTYIVVSVCGLIQAVFLSDRANQTSVNVSAADWLQAISSFILFGGGSKITYAAAILFWAILSAYLIRWAATRRSAADQVLSLTPLFSSLAALLIYFAGALSVSNVLDGTYLRKLSPLALNSKHFLIPYSLVFFVALACTRNHRAAQTMTVSLISIICGAGFLTVDRPERASRAGLLSHANLQWIAFTKFREIRPDIDIPTNPQWPTYPPLFKVSINTKSNLARSQSPILLVPQNSGTSSEAQTAQSVYFDIKRYCVTSNYLALEIDVWRSRMGWANVYWGETGLFDPQRSLGRFYPPGSSRMQFAFRRELSDNLLRLDPSEGVEPELLEKLSSLREILPRYYGVTLAEPTEAGGEYRIEAVRLFCLN